MGRCGSFDNLKKSYNWYRKNPKDKDKQCYSDNRKVYRLLQKINHLEEGKGQERDVMKTKYEEDCGKIKSILACYKSIKQLNEHNNEYRVSKKREYHKAHNDYQQNDKTMKKSDCMKEKTILNPRISLM